MGCCLQTKDFKKICDYLPRPLRKFLNKKFSKWTSIFLEVFVMSTKKIATMGILTAASVLLNIYSIPTPTFSISFTYIPLFISGALLGPFAGLGVGLIGDILGVFIRGDAFNPLIWVSTGLIGFISGIVFKFSSLNDYIKILISFLLVYVICTIALNTTALWLMFGGNRTYFAYLAIRLPLQTPVWAINLGTAVLIWKPIKMFENRFNFR